jgi:glyoxylase-like metal-dependent hydrolase (beta-lactamase superfamily II)
MLVVSGDRTILIDTGMGNKQDAKFFSHYQPHETIILADALQKINIGVEDITDVLLTHVHFDHVGGAVNNENGTLKLALPNATYWVSAPHWETATNPNRREKASFLKENIMPLMESGQLKLIELPPFKSDTSLQEIHFAENISCIVVNGHTQGMLLPKIQYGKHQIVFMADLLPSVGHLPIPFVMGYDMQPLFTLNEKEIFLNEACNKNYTLFFEHDSVNECCDLHMTEKGIRAKNCFSLESLTSSI